MILSFFLDDDLAFMFDAYLPPNCKHDTVLSLKSLSLSFLLLYDTALELPLTTDDFLLV
tara:strand:+ start:834 stop:1010 length:177 start_codon:yes stop_codon:yes gene_type:complete